MAEGRMQQEEVKVSPRARGRLRKTGEEKANHKELKKRLMSLVHLDIDAVMAYDRALRHIEDPEIYEQINEFKKDHQRHVNDLSYQIHRLGGLPPRFTPDVKGMILEGFTALRSFTGTAGALKAMKANEKLTNRVYEQAAKGRWPRDMKEIIQSNFEDEKRHLEYIEMVLEERFWEGSEEARG